jgi:hypothetical protein
MSAKQWARVRRTGAHGLRRGAWYPVVNDTKPNLVFLDVNRKNVPMDRTLLEFREGPPDSWSVVQRRPDEPEPNRANLLPLDLTYGVCPQCRARSNLAPGAERAPCRICGGDFGIDWAHPC